MLELSSTVGHPADVTENCLVWGKNPTHLVSEVLRVFSVSSKGDTLERETQKEVENLVFPYMGGEKWLFFLFRHI